MKRKMNIVTWMGIFLIIIQSCGGDSSFFRESGIRDIDRRLVKFDFSNRFNRYRILDKRKFLSGNSLALEIDTDTSAAISESLSIDPLKLTSDTHRTTKFSDMKRRSRKISTRERSIRKSVIEFLPEMSNGIHVSKMSALSGDSSPKANEPIRIRDMKVQRRLSNGRKYRLSEDRRMNRLRENIRSNIRRENENEERISNMRFRDTDFRKTFRLVKWETSDLSTPSVTRETGLFHRQARFVVPKRLSFKGEARNVVRKETNGAERYIRNDRYNNRNLPSLKLSEIVRERNTDSKLQQPRSERHLLVPKRELKIPSEEVRYRAANGRRFRKSFRVNDISHGNMEETTNERKNGRGLKGTLEKRLNSSRRQSIDAVVRHRQNRMAMLESERISELVQTSRSARNSGVESSRGIQNRQTTSLLGFSRRNCEVFFRTSTISCQSLESNFQLQTRRNTQSTRIESSKRIQNKQRTGVLDFSRKNMDVSSRTSKTSCPSRESNFQMQTRKNSRNSGIESSERIQNKQRTDVLDHHRKAREVSNRAITSIFQAIDNNNSIRKLRINELTSNRRQDKRFSKQAAIVLTKERINFYRERKLSNENRQLNMRAPNKENIPNGLPIRSRRIRNQDKAIDTLKNGKRRTAENATDRKQRNTRSDERFQTQIRNERSILTINKLSETRSRDRNLQIRNKRIDRERNMESRRSAIRLNKALNDQCVKSENEIRTSTNKEIVRRIFTDSLELKAKAQMVRSNDNKISSVDINIRNTHRKIASNQRSERRAENVHLSRENDRRIQELQRCRNVDSRSRRSEPRTTVGRFFRSHRIRDELKQSKLRVSSDLREKSSVRMAAQTRKELGFRENEQQRRISIRSASKHLISFSKLHSTAMNSTSKDYAGGIYASKFKEIAPSKKPIVSSDQSVNLYRSITPTKSSSSNKSFMDFYAYLSEKRSSFISLILNVILGLAVIIASSDDKNKGIIPRRLTPFVDGFLKYTTVS